jgi:hypothetical protein
LPRPNLALPKELAGLLAGAPNGTDVALLGDVAEAAERYRSAEEERQKAREELRA